MKEKKKKKKKEKKVVIQKYIRRKNIFNSIYDINLIPNSTLNPGEAIGINTNFPDINLSKKLIQATKNTISKNKTPYNYLEVESKVNEINISSCYDNPQRDHILKMINEKKKQNPDKIVEVLFTQFPSPLPFYPDMYQPYNQYNPYMNMYMMPTPQNYQMQTPMIHSPINNNNNITISFINSRSN